MLAGAATKKQQRNQRIKVIEIKLNPPTKDLRIFSLLLMPFSIFVGYLIYHYFQAVIPASSITGVLFLIGATGSIWPSSVRWLFVGWMIAAFPIGWTVSHAVLALVFFGLFWPISLVAKIFGYDPLQLKSRQADSYWQDLKPVETKHQYFRQF